MENTCLKHRSSYKFEMTLAAFRNLGHFELADLRVMYTQMIGTMHFVSRPCFNKDVHYNLASIFTPTMYVYTNHVCLHQPCMFTPTMYVYTNHVCLHQPCMFTPTMYVYTNHVCLHQPCMFTPTMYVYTNHVCLHQPCMFTPTMYVLQY